MKLIELSCDHSSFKTIKFNSEGLTLIIGDGSHSKSEQGSSNGVGKTLSLGLIHHCLGANANPKLVSAVPDWMFRLVFSLGNNIHEIERSGDGKEIFLDRKKLNVTRLREWLNESGAFNFIEKIEQLTFRALFTRFARYDREDCTNPIRTNKETDYVGLLRSMYLLGADCSLVINKHKFKKNKDEIKQSENNWKNDSILKEMFRAGAKPKLRVEWLDREISRIKLELEKFQVAENYNQIQLLTEGLTTQLREIEQQISVIKFQLAGIEKLLSEQPDITKNDLLALYDGLQATFKPEALAHFEAVEKFHNSLSINRKLRLENDRLKLLSKLNKLETTRKDTGIERDKHLYLLRTKKALDEYVTVVKKLAELEEERSRLNEFLSYSEHLQQKAQELREKSIQEDREASEYLKEKPLSFVDKKYTEMAELLYPSHPAGIILENNTGDNQLRYNLTVQIEGDDSDGINAARIICFDWILLMYGFNHSMRFLWHDNRFFADIDPKQRAELFVFLYESLKGMGIQYIATLNTENYEAMKQFLSEEMQEKLSKTVVLTLKGDKPENKLLGIQFGSQ